MSDGDRNEAMRQAAREVLRELLPDLIGELRAPAPEHPSGQIRNGHNGNGHRTAAPEAIPVVPAPPVAAVLRPSTWSAPPAPGEVIGDGSTAEPATESATEPPTAAPAGAEPVTLDTDADLQRFVAGLLKRFDNPRERRALRTGATRFTLRRTAATPAPAGAAGPALRIDKGAVTERIVREAAASGARLVLARRAVLTPLARDQARALHVAIERERL